MKPSSCPLLESILHINPDDIVVFCTCKCAFVDVSYALGFVKVAMSKIKREREKIQSVSSLPTAMYLRHPSPPFTNKSTHLTTLCKDGNLWEGLQTRHALTRPWKTRNVRKERSHISRILMLSLVLLLMMMLLLLHHETAQITTRQIGPDDRDDSRCDLKQTAEVNPKMRDE